jgi:hypothetical protein
MTASAAKTIKEAAAVRAATLRASPLALAGMPATYFEYNSGRAFQGRWQRGQ